MARSARSNPDRRDCRVRGRRSQLGPVRRHNGERGGGDTRHDRAERRRRDARARGSSRPRSRTPMRAPSAPRRRRPGRPAWPASGRTSRRRPMCSATSRAPASTRPRCTRCSRPTTASRSRRTPGAVSDLMDLPGVKAVHVIPLVELDNHSSVPLIGSQQAWGTYGMTGTGMSIAVIDTGVDYVHRGFGGSGSSADYLDRGQRGGEPAGGDGQPGRFHGHERPDADLPDREGGRRLRLRRRRLQRERHRCGADPAAGPEPEDCNGHGTHVVGHGGGHGRERGRHRRTPARTTRRPT